MYLYNSTTSILFWSYLAWSQAMLQNNWEFFVFLLYPGRLSPMRPRSIDPRRFTPAKPRQTPIPNTTHMLTRMTKASHYAQMNSSNILTTVDATSLFSRKKSNEFTQSHAMKHSTQSDYSLRKQPSFFASGPAGPSGCFRRLVRRLQTNPVAFHLLLPTILPFVPYQVS